jgi:hypothetical protein
MAGQLEFLADLDLLPAIPPGCILILEDVLASRLAGVRLRVFLGNVFIYRCVIFFFTSVELFSDSSSVISD